MIINGLYKAYPAPYTREVARRIDFHYTPKHGSWLTIAEYLLIISFKNTAAALDNDFAKARKLIYKA